MDSGLVSHRVARTVDLSVGVLIFWLFNVVLSPLNAVPVVGGLLDLAGGLALAILVPIFVFSLPTAHVRWSLGNSTPFRDNHELNFEKQREINCIIDVTVNYNSVLSWFLLRRAVRHGTYIKITFRPNGVIRVKEDLSYGGAVVDMDKHSVTLPISVADRNAKQECRASLWFLAASTFKGADRVQVSTKSTWDRVERAKVGTLLSVTSDVLQLPVRN